ncbi:MAG TPA: hypothetical protein VGN09_01725 [Vicinamibacteria bacterium]
MRAALPGAAPRWTGRRALVVLFLLTLPLVTPKVRGADEIEYFSYLRSLAFDHDVEFGNEYDRFYAADPQGLAGFKATFLDRRETETDRHINFAPLGCALLWAPFYLLAHACVLAARALGSGVAADGFSFPYVAAVCYASVLYGLAGLLLVHDTLRAHGRMPAPAATLAVAALWLGTPLLYYMTLAPAFSHASGVFAVALLVWLSLRAAARPLSAWWEWAGIGAAGGLAALVREQDGLFLVIPMGLVAHQAISRRAWVSALVRVAALGGAALLAFSPQLFAYRALTGRFGPSRLVARKMSWSSPHLWPVLFDPGHGLFAWSPLLLVAAAGLLYLVGRRRDLTVALLALALLLQVWINGAVESWTQAGAFGSRRFVSSTPVFAWGLAALLAAVPARRLRFAVLALALFVGWNMGLMVQFGLRLMDRQRLEWPRVAVNQVSEVPRHLARAAWLFFTDRERLVREGP